MSSSCPSSTPAENPNGFGMVLQSTNQIYQKTDFTEKIVVLKSASNYYGQFFGIKKPFFQIPE